MEQSSAWLIKSLLGLKLPKTHLEFGTWEGFGVCLALNATSAQIWTIDKDELLDVSKYPTRYKNFENNDKLEVGWLYKLHKEASRVTQIHADSMQFDWNSLAEIGFESVIIDGGHDFEVVQSDTAQVIKLIKPGALVIWDDFNLSFDRSDAELGVMEYLEKDIINLASKFDLHHLLGTQLLFGFRKNS